MPSIKLQSSDGETFPVDVDIARQSVTIRTMLEDLGMEEEEDEVVPLPNVNAAILKKVITLQFSWWLYTFSLNMPQLLNSQAWAESYEVSFLWFISDFIIVNRNDSF